ncbi:MAG TPA: hemerythrin domain-containing protein [Candidatus Margulisiibacteriota bacterium]|nr:hemerythrin domain-containing protein [Candidatus Margulisiibacteriota bacterium]
MAATIELLSTQHQDVLARLATVEAQIMARDGCDLAAFAAYLETEVGQHFVIEEQALFPLLARYLGEDDGPLAVMNTEHAAFRELLAALTTAVRSGQSDAQRARAGELVQLLRAHIAKEDQVLFPMAARLLSEAEQGDVDRRAAALTTAPVGATA